MMMLMDINKFKHNMIREIFEEPEVIRKTLKHISIDLDKKKDLIPDKFNRTYITGSGTSYHAGFAGGYALSTISGISSSILQASEFASWIPQSLMNFLLIAFSQSGESKDVLAAIKVANERKADIIAVTNTSKSTLARMAKLPLITQAGKELSVTATKTYIAQLSAIYQLSINLSETSKYLSIDLLKFKKALNNAANLVKTMLETQSRIIQHIAIKYKKNNFIFLLGSGPNFSTALEGALKLKESCNIFAEGYAAREFLHGPMQLVNRETPVFFLVPPEKSEINEWLDLMNRFKNFGAPIISISTENSEVINNSIDSIIIPKGLPTVLTPILYVVPLQLFSYYSSITRGLNPDAPEKLSKVVK